MDLIFILFVLFILLAIMTVVGHVIWVVLRWIIRWVFDLDINRDEPPPTIYTPPPDPKTERLKDLATTERQIVKFYRDGKINDEIYEKLLASIREEVEPLTRKPERKPEPVVKPVVEPVRVSQPPPQPPRVEQPPPPPPRPIEPPPPPRRPFSE